MNAPLSTPRHTVLRSLCEQYCATYGLKFSDLFLSDDRSTRCFRSRGRGRPTTESHYPALIVSSTIVFLLLASQRKTELTIDQIAQALGLDEWDALEMTATAESRLQSDHPSDLAFASQFESFLDGLDSDSRKQSCTVKQTREMTFEDIGAALKPPVTWQRAQQIYNKALLKLQENPGALKEFMP